MSFSEIGCPVNASGFTELWVWWASLAMLWPVMVLDYTFGDICGQVLDVKQNRQDWRDTFVEALNETVPYLNLKMED